MIIYTNIKDRFEFEILNILGSIAGDIVGSVYEWGRVKTADFPLFGNECDFADQLIIRCYGSKKGEI